MAFNLKRQSDSGFSLVELMIVVGIIGVLAAVATPKMQVFMAKAKQAEAKTTLSHIYTLEEAYFAENSSYDTTANVGFQQDGKVLYTVTTDAVSGALTFRVVVGNSAALCSGVGINQDRWAIDQTKAMTNTHKGVASASNGPFKAPACT
jgi:prepilin-type N-terminal cleavage/methylation domain-containing protein